VAGGCLKKTERHKKTALGRAVNGGCPGSRTFAARRALKRRREIHGLRSRAVHRRLEKFFALQSLAITSEEHPDTEVSAFLMAHRIGASLNVDKRYFLRFDMRNSHEMSK
jgi:hypothetical protein